MRRFASNSRRSRRLGLASIALAFCVAGCREQAPRSNHASDAPKLAGAAAPQRTTDGAVALANFEGQLSQSAKMLAANPASLGAVERHVGLLLARTQYRGTYRDLVTVKEILTAAIVRWPDNATIQLQHAKFLSRVHKFGEALAVLGAIKPTASNKRELADLYATIYQATGAKPELVDQHRTEQLTAARTFDSTSAMAGWLAAQGKYAEADALYAEAATLYRDTSPFPLAWLAFQRGLMWSEMADDPAKGVAFYQDAVRMLPGYVMANVHLAEQVVPRGEARTRLLAMSENSDDPEVAMVLAESAATPAEAQAYIARAHASYEALLSQFPEAFWDHAAEFYLDQGNNPAKALDYARQNWELRQTPRAKDLLARATRSP